MLLYLIYVLFLVLDICTHIICQDEIILVKMGPHMKDEPPRIDQQICEDVLKKRRIKGIFLSDLSKTSCISAPSILESAEVPQDLEQQSAAPRYQQLEARIQAVEEKSEDLKRKHTDFQVLQKSYDDINFEMKSRLQDMETLVGFLLKTTCPSD